MIARPPCSLPDPLRSPAMDIVKIGSSPRRREDARFVTGRGGYLDDCRFEPVDRHRGGRALSRRVGGADGERCCGRRPQAAPPLRRGERPDLRALRLCAPAAARRRRVPLPRRARRAGDRRDGGTGAGRRGAARGRLRGPARDHHRAQRLRRPTAPASTRSPGSGRQVCAGL